MIYDYTKCISCNSTVKQKLNGKLNRKLNSKRNSKKNSKRNRRRVRMIQIDYRDKRPIYEQITEKIQALILQGVLQPDMQLPSVRKLAVDLSINPNTIQKAYNQLENLGLVYSVKGRGSYISPNLELIQLQTNQYYKELEEVVRRGVEKGIREEDMLNKVKAFYRGGHHD